MTMPRATSFLDPEIGPRVRRWYNRGVIATLGSCAVGLLALPASAAAIWVVTDLLGFRLSQWMVWSVIVVLALMFFHLLAWEMNRVWRKSRHELLPLGVSPCCGAMLKHEGARAGPEWSFCPSCLSQWRIEARNGGGRGTIAHGDE
jgi:hypothetical protein